MSKAKRVIRKESRLSQSNTPIFWKRVRNWSLLVGAVSAAVLTGGAALPAVAITIATIVTTAAATTASIAATRREKDLTGEDK